MNRIARLLMALVAVFGGCSRRGLQGNGVVKTENRSVADFTRIAVTGAYQVRWFPGKPDVSVTADENLLPHIKTTIHGDTLQIDSDENLRSTGNITVVVSSAALNDAEFSGAITFTASQVSAAELKLEATGASSITVDGGVTNLDASLTGASRLSAHSLQAKFATLTLTGAANADVAVSEALHVSVTGAGTLTYSGDPKSVEKNIIGAGSVRRRP